MQVIPSTSFRRMPWKNGKGVTHEAIRVPLDSNEFLWRVSVAEVDTSGPFSEFHGYQRYLVLLRGRGLELEVDGGVAQRLERPGDLIQFDGAAFTQCQLFDGPCADLNLLVNKTISGAHAWVAPVHQPLEVTAEETGVSLIFAIEGEFSLGMSSGTALDGLKAGDLAILSAEESTVVTGRAGACRGNDSSARFLVFRATVPYAASGQG